MDSVAIAIAMAIANTTINDSMPFPIERIITSLLLWTLIPIDNLCNRDVSLYLVLMCNNHFNLRIGAQQTSDYLMTDDLPLTRF